MRRRADVDGGWAYLVGLGVFISYFLISGFGRSFGLLYAAFLDTFDHSDSVTSLLVGVRSACAIISGPLGTALSQKFSERKVVIAGALVTSLGFSLSFFAPSLEFLIFTVGALQGFGSTLLIGPSAVCMGKYFVKKRSRAMTVTSCGGCIGMMVVPILLQKLVEHYSVRGALLIYGALSLHLILTGAFLRPLEADDKGPSHDQEHCDFKQEDLKSETNISVPVLTQGLCPYKDKDWKILEENAELKDESSEKYGFVFTSSDESDCRTDIRIENCVQKLTPKQPAQPHIATVVPTTHKIRRLLRLVLDTFDFSLLRNPLFVIILISGTLSGIPYVTMTMFLVPLLESRGTSRNMAAILLSVMGGCDILGRLVCGALADRKPLQPKHVIILTSVLGGIVCSLLAIVTDFYGFLGLAIAYGLVCSAPNILVMPATVTFVGLAALPKAVGLLLFFFGITTAAAPSLLGLLKDTTGSYSSIFPVMGCIHISAGLVLVLEPLARRWTRRRHLELAA